ncbi:hypothetical protein DASB73_012470 [Starmerella bacillaris]|uniref:Uncharacterized protein n=1 Tax=Starmerella bacillaris TaxID=1247836 RepID=A0AAV5RFD7_STABA|nr:hypothetical protein DASB73_012470 [Starmerella bacillaris]
MATNYSSYSTQFTHAYYYPQPTVVYSSNNAYPQPVPQPVPQQVITDDANSRFSIARPASANSNSAPNTPNIGAAQSASAGALATPNLGSRKRVFSEPRLTAQPARYRRTMNKTGANATPNQTTQAEFAGINQGPLPTGSNSSIPYSPMPISGFQNAPALSSSSSLPLGIQPYPSYGYSSYQGTQRIQGKHAVNMSTSSLPSLNPQPLNIPTQSHPPQSPRGHRYSKSYSYANNHNNSQNQNQSQSQKKNHHNRRRYNNSVSSVDTSTDSDSLTTQTSLSSESSLQSDDEHRTTPLKRQPEPKLTTLAEKEKEVKTKAVENPPNETAVQNKSSQFPRKEKEVKLSLVDSNNKDNGVQLKLSNTTSDKEIKVQVVKNSSSGSDVKMRKIRNVEIPNDIEVTIEKEDSPTMILPSELRRRSYVLPPAKKPPTFHIKQPSSVENSSNQTIRPVTQAPQDNKVQRAPRTKRVRKAQQESVAGQETNPMGQIVPTAVSTQNTEPPAPKHSLKAAEPMVFTPPAVNVAPSAPVTPAIPTPTVETSLSITQPTVVSQSALIAPVAKSLSTLMVEEKVESRIRKVAKPSVPESSPENKVDTDMVELEIGLKESIQLQECLEAAELLGVEPQMLNSSLVNKEVQSVDESEVEKATVSASNNKDTIRAVKPNSTDDKNTEDDDYIGTYNLSTVERVEFTRPGTPINQLTSAPSGRPLPIPCAVPLTPENNKNAGTETSSSASSSPSNSSSLQPVAITTTSTSRPLVERSPKRNAAPPVIDYMQQRSNAFTKRPLPPVSDSNRSASDSIANASTDNSNGKPRKGLFGKKLMRAFSKKTDDNLDDGSSIRSSTSTMSTLSTRSVRSIRSIKHGAQNTFTNISVPSFLGLRRKSATDLDNSQTNNTAVSPEPRPRQDHAAIARKRVSAGANMNRTSVAAVYPEEALQKLSLVADPFDIPASANASEVIIQNDKECSSDDNEGVIKLSAGDIFPGGLNADNINTIVSSVERTGSFERNPSISRKQSLSRKRSVKSVRPFNATSHEPIMTVRKLKSCMKSSNGTRGRERSIQFAEQILVYKTHDALDYDRTPGKVTCDNLKEPGMVQRIREELNVVKLTMPVHPNSQKYTQFFY